MTRSQGSPTSNFKLRSPYSNYLTVTAGYWAFTVTDGAIRMLVVLYFHLLGFSPFEVAMLFLFYEFFGVVTNLVGGWLGARIGLNLTMHIGMGMQVVALSMLTVPDAWLSVAYVMAAQALSGIAKDLNKMSAKAAVKTLTAGGEVSDAEQRLFRWVAVLTGSKNALKGVGFFVGALLLEWLGFRGALILLASALAVVLLVTAVLLPSGVGRMKSKPKFTQVFSRIPAINWLSAARFFLFGSRDVWFVVGLPVFLYEGLGWSFMEVGGFLALWVIGYGFVQASAPRLVGSRHGGASARLWAAVLLVFPVAIALALDADWPADWVLVVGLIAFGVVFAINSAVHSYLILAYSDHDKVAMNVGFYYMANAGGRLTGTVLSGALYQWAGLPGCLWASALLVALAALFSLRLPTVGGAAGQH
ncbi:MAG: organoarsenical effux MFS transporter ArsJ [Gammaproteobacteria bacterium]